MPSGSLCLPQQDLGRPVPRFLLQEMNTRERFNASARVRVNVLDGDDQYPQFLPCTPRAPHSPPVCTSPVYTANVTEGQLQVGHGAARTPRGRGAQGRHVSRTPCPLLVPRRVP